MRVIVSLICISLLISCNRVPEDKNVYDKILDLEIARRIEMLSLGSKDSTINQLIADYSPIQQEINNLILLTKDAENPNAGIQKSNQYFKNAVEKYRISYEGFVLLDKTMSLPTLESMIKTNQLNLLDKIIFNYITLTNDTTVMNSVY